MRTLKALTIAGMVAAGFQAAAVQAAPTFTLGHNEIFFNNFENIYRSDANCAALGGCLGAGTGPAGWQLTAPTANNVRVGDVIVGIFNIQNIDAGGSTIWFSSGTDQFTGYFAQQVISINNGGPTGVPGSQIDPYSGALVPYDHITLGNPTTDPFGILAAGEMFRLYTQEGGGTTAFSSGGSGAGSGLAGVQADIAAATDGALWASLGTGAVNQTTPGVADADGFVYSHVDLSQTIDNLSDQETFLALNLVTAGPGYNAGTLDFINSINENEVGGNALPHTPANGIPCVPSATVACNQVVGTGEIEANTRSALLFGGTSPWVFASNDPLEISIPEPGSLALFGIALLGLGFGAMRRRMS